MKKLIPFVLVAIVLAGLIFTGKIDFSKPNIDIRDIGSIGKDSDLKLSVKDENSSIGKVYVSLVQNGREVFVYKNDNLGEKSSSLNIKLNPSKFGLTEGEAILRVVVSNNAIIKRTNIYEKNVKVDLSSPLISLVDWTKNIINGGTGFVFFKSSEPLKDSYVKIGDYKFKCLSIKDSYVCPFSFPYLYDSHIPVLLVAHDYADNTTSQSLSYNLKLVNYGKSTLNIDDNFIESKIKPLSDRRIDDRIELFKYVNIEVRKRNEDLIHKITSQCKNKEPMFEGYFSYLENSAKLGGFADYRRYSYNGRIIDGADAYHKGFDFASVKNAPVKASNKGEVVFAGFLGIYGNSVIIDHGVCVYSLYSHLDQIFVKDGQKVDKDTVIGKTGTTGLAAGDHLHYGVLVNGLEVYPLEWFDQKWLETRFYTPFKQIKGGN